MIINAFHYYITKENNLLDAGPIFFFSCFFFLCFSPSPESVCESCVLPCLYVAFVLFDVHSHVLVAKLLKCFYDLTFVLFSKK